MRFALAFLLLIAAAIAVLLAGKPGRGAPLWPGASHTIEERDRAVLRGLAFLYRFSHTPGNFERWGQDLMGAFYEIATTSANPELRRTAWRMARERALEWRRLHPSIPADTDPTDMTDLIWGNYTAERLGVPDPQLTAALKAAVRRFTVVDYLGFDPRLGPPPAGNRYDLFEDALINTSVCDLAGIPLGASYDDVLKWLPAMRPWPDRSFSGIYCATHVIYTYNGYGRFRLERACFPDEFEYLRRNLQRSLQDNDPEILGEYLDSLRSFGLSLEDPSIRAGYDSLLAKQNQDGSWGDPKESDPYIRYHPTWTAIDGLRDYLWPTVRPCPVF